MNGVHDIGGMDGFGPIHREADEPVFHEPWESRVFAIFLTGPGLPPVRFDGDRHRIEQLEPIRYLNSSYYERWLAALESGLIEAGTLSRNEIEAKVKQFAGNPELTVPRREDPTRTERIANAVRSGRPATRKIRQKARFAIGDRIVTRNLNPHGHTRLPRYARGKRGIIIAHHGAHVFPDTHAHGLGENPQHLYTVRFKAHELWGDDGEPSESVLIDLWESYLEKNKVAIKSAANSPRPVRKQAVAKPVVPAAKIQTRAALPKHVRAASLSAPMPSSPGKRRKSKVNGRTSSSNRRSDSRKRRS